MTYGEGWRDGYGVGLRHGRDRLTQAAVGSGLLGFALGAAAAILIHLFL